MARKTAKKFAPIGALVLMVAILAPILYIKNAKAANLTEAYVRLDRISASPTTTGGTVCARSATAQVETTVKVTFPTGFATVDTPANWTITTTNLPNGATPWIGIGTASAASGQDVTFPSGDMVVGTLYCFNFSGTNTLTNATAGDNQVGSITTQLAGPTEIDKASYSLSIISNDQIVVSATVPPVFTFSLSGNTDTFTGNLTTASGGISTSGRTASISTNANNGWVTWVSSANAGLSSIAASSTIATGSSATDNTPYDLASGGNTGYVLDVSYTDSGTGEGTVSQASNWGAEYDGNGTTSGGNLSTSFQPVAASDGTTGGDTLTFIERARITAVQAAATDYTDTLTIVSAGRF